MRPNNGTGRLRGLIAAAAICGVAGMSGPMQAQSSSPSFTADQVHQGASAYKEKCQDCHGDNLGGSDSGPPLAGGYFASQWGGQPVGDFFQVISTTMPANRPGTLTSDETASIVAYILCSNGAPTGAAPLTNAKADLDVKTPAESTSACSAK